MRLAVGQSPFFCPRANHPLDWLACFRTPNNRFTISLTERGYGLQWSARTTWLREPC